MRGTPSPHSVDRTRSDLRDLALADVDGERSRQEIKFGDRTAAHPGSMTDGERLAILMEEVGELATEVMREIHRDQSLDHLYRRGQETGIPVLDGPPVDHDDPRHAMRHELVQIAAVAVAWIEALTEAPVEEWWREGPPAPGVQR